MIRQVKECAASTTADYWYKRMNNHHARLSKVVFHTLFGIESNIPICCVAEFIWRLVFKKQAPAYEMWLKGLDSKTGFVPCSYHLGTNWAEPIQEEMRKYLRRTYASDEKLMAVIKKVEEYEQRNTATRFHALFINRDGRLVEPSPALPLCVQAGDEIVLYGAPEPSEGVRP